MRIIPAIDIIDGKCVRLSQGDYNQKTVYNENPLEVAKAFEDSGIEYLHLVDLDGAKAKRIVNGKVLETIASKTNLKIDFGGGIKTGKDVRQALESGASQITGGSVALQNPELFTGWLTTYSKNKIILGADCRYGKIMTDAWQTGSSMEVLDFIRDYRMKGVQYVVCTDVQKDGMLEGPSIELYKKILEQNDIKLIASGGVSSMQDILDLEAIGCDGVIIGKAIYEGKIKLKELEVLC